MSIDYLCYILHKKTYEFLKKTNCFYERPLLDESGKEYRTFYNKKIYSATEGNSIITDLLNGKRPCMIGRIGTVEMGVLNNYLAQKSGIVKHINKNSVRLLCNNAGFFPPTEEAIQKWCVEYFHCVSKMDVCAVFENHAEDFVLNRYGASTQLVQLCALEPYYFKNPWSMNSLRNKKVLVIHPFENTIKNQYLRYNKLFGGNVLPKFELKTIKAVQSAAGEITEYESWFEALDSMKEKIAETEFDIAILGCGAYGLPLAAYIKEINKKAIIVGGATQILFGIRGARWDNNAMINKWFDENWVHPQSNERPDKADLVEGGCYW